MDRAYEGDKMRAVAKKLGYNPVVPPKKNRIDPWEYDRILYKRRNEVERFFRRIKRFRRVFTRYDKFDIVFAGFILFAMIFDSLVGTDSMLCLHELSGIMALSQRRGCHHGEITASA